VAFTTYLFLAIFCSIYVFNYCFSITAFSLLQVAATKSNATSSRSHAVLTLYVTRQVHRIEIRLFEIWKFKIFICFLFPLLCQFGFEIEFQDV